MGNELILVVDDEPEIGNIVSRVLERENYRVLVASSGAEALHIMGTQDTPIDMVITDLVMPGIGGRELVWRLQQLHADVCVILLSGYADEGALQMLDSMRSAFLEKPIDLDLLASTVRSLLEQRA